MRNGEDVVMIIAAGNELDVKNSNFERSCLSLFPANAIENGMYAELHPPSMG